MPWQGHSDLFFMTWGVLPPKKKRKGGEREMVYSSQLVSHRSLYSDFQCVQNYLCGRSELQGAGHAVRCDEKKASFAHTVIANGNE